jgi:hypothetical protein
VSNPSEKHPYVAIHLVTSKLHPLNLTIKTTNHPTKYIWVLDNNYTCICLGTIPQEQRIIWGLHGPFRITNMNWVSDESPLQMKKQKMMMLTIKWMKKMTKAMAIMMIIIMEGEDGNLLSFTQSHSLSAVCLCLYMHVMMVHSQ